MPGRQRAIPLAGDVSPADRLAEDTRKIKDRLKDPSDKLTSRGARNKLTEAMGEYGARQWVQRTYGAQVVGEVDVVRRNVRGAPVLDLVFELTDGRMVVLEAKGGAGRLKKTQRVVFAADETGIVRKVTSGRNQQFSPAWFEDRLDELRRRGQRRLANRLGTFRELGRLEAAVVYVDARGEVTRVDWRTDEWNRAPAATTRPSATPSAATSSADRAVRAGDRATDTGTARQQRPDVGPGPKPVPDTRPDATTRLDRPDATGFGLSGRARKALNAASELMDQLDFDPLDKALKPLRLSFSAGLVISLVVELMFYLLERRLARENARGFGRDYGLKVYKGMRDPTTGKTLQQLVEDTVALVHDDDGTFEQMARTSMQKFRIYADYRYDMKMEIVAEDLADVVVFALRGLKFAEVYAGVDPVGIVTLVRTAKLYGEAQIYTQERGRPGKDDIVRYHCRHRLLLWDPVVHQRSVDLWNWHVGCRNAMKNALKGITGPVRVVALLHARAMLEMVVDYRFLEIVAFLDGEHPLNDTLGTPDALLRKAFADLRRNAVQGDLVTARAADMQVDRRALLAMFAGRDVFGERTGAQKTLTGHRLSNLRAKLRGGP